VVDQRRHEHARELARARDLRVAAAHDRHDEALLRLHREAEVVAVEVDDRVAVEARVQLRDLLQRFRARLQHLRDERREVDLGEVALLDPRHRGNRVRAGHVLGDQPANAAQRLAPALSLADVSGV
jgi:hypothetical protein